LKNNKAKAIRFSTLEAICRELDCQPADLLEYQANKEIEGTDRQIEIMNNDIILLKNNKTILQLGKFCGMIGKGGA